jgi:hypothetical protein
MKITRRIFYIVFLIIILNINISSAKEITINKITTIEMDYSSFNVSTKYESTGVQLSEIYSDGFMGYNNNSTGEINYDGLWKKPNDFITRHKVEGTPITYYTIYFITLDTNYYSNTQKQLAYINITNLYYDKLFGLSNATIFTAIKTPININKTINTEFIYNYELRLKSKYPSIEPAFLYSDLDNVNDKYVTQDTQIINLRSYSPEQFQTKIFTLYYEKKTFETIDRYNKIKIINDDRIEEIFDITTQPIVLVEDNFDFAAPRDLGAKYDKILQVEDVYFIVNNQKLVATRYNNISQMQVFFLKNNEPFTGYSIEELLNNNKILMLTFRTKGDNSVKVHYKVSGIINKSVIRDSKDFFSKDINIDPVIELSTNSTHTTEVEIPEGYFIDPNSINYKDFLVTNLNIDSKSVIWQYKNYNIHLPFKFTYSKNIKKFADLLFYINIAFVILISLVFILIPDKQFIEKLVIPSIGTFFIPLIFLFFNYEISESVNVIIYSDAYLPPLLIFCIIFYNYIKKNKHPSKKAKGKRMTKQ